VEDGTLSPVAPPTSAPIVPDLHEDECELQDALKFLFVTENV